MENEWTLKILAPRLPPNHWIVYWQFKSNFMGFNGDLMGFHGDVTINTYLVGGTPTPRKNMSLIIGFHGI